MHYDHHPDPAIAFCVELDAIEGLLAEAKAGMIPFQHVKDRMELAMSFRVGGDAGAVSAKRRLRDLIKSIR